VVVVVSVADVAFGGSVPGGVTGAAFWPGRAVAGRRRWRSASGDVLRGQRLRTAEVAAH